jgi:peptidoglycan/LPS O-acetylase OafA/YrhL
VKHLLAAVVPPSSGQRFPALDGLRGVAMLMVLFGHFCGRGAVGAVGVCVFFALSAFLLFHPFATKRPVDLGQYYRRRFWRIYPAWAFALLVGTAVTLVVAGKVSPAALATHALFIHTLRRQWATAILGPGWCMPAFVQFYAVLPAVAWVYRRWPFSLAILLIVVAGARLVVSSPSAAELNWPTVGLPFVGGLLVSHFVSRGYRPPIWTGPLAVVGTAGVTAYSQQHVVQMASGLMPRHLVLILGPHAILSSFAVSSLIAWLAVTESPVARPFLWVALRFVGVCSYSIFLLHGPIQLALRAIAGTTAATLIGLPLSLVVGWWSYLHVEFPFRHGLPRSPARPLPTQ